MNIQRIHHAKAWTAMAAGGVVLAAVLLGAGLWWQGSGAKASRAQQYRAAIAQLEANQVEVAAVVNGTDIPVAKLAAYGVFRSSGLPFGETAADRSPREYLDLLIDNELLFQEAGRRGLVPGDAEVQRAATDNEAGLQALINGDTEQGRQLRAVFAEAEGTAYDLDNYDSSPLMLDNQKRAMAVAAVWSQLVAELPEADRQDLDKREAQVGALVRSLRASARIDVLVALP